MHPTISYQLAQARIADLRQHAQWDTQARAARRARPDQLGPFSPPWQATSRRAGTRLSAGLFTPLKG